MKVKEMISKFDFDETVQVLQRSVEENGLKVVSLIDAQANLRKIGIEIDGNKILEVFHPKLAKEVFDKDLRAGIVPPIRIYIYVQNGITHVAVQNASDLFSGYNDLNELALNVDKMLEAVTKSVIQ